MMKRIIPIFVFAALFLFSGCEKISDKLKEATQKDVEIEDITFESEEMEVFPAPDGTGDPNAFHPFEETQTINLADLEGGSELTKYNKEHIKGVSCESASIYVFSSGDKPGTVKGFVAETTKDPLLKLSIPEYVLKSVYSEGDVKKFVEDLMWQVLTRKDNEVTLKLSGETNLPETERLKMKVSIKKIKVKIQGAN